MASLTAKIFAVTGGASGIGAATCRLLAERGAGVICVADVSSTNFGSLQKSITEINSLTLVQCTVLDVTSSEDVNQWLRDIVSSHGNLHGAANIAGVAQGAGLRTTPTILAETDADWSRILKVNLDGVFYCTRAQVRAMTDLPKGNRSIVNVASIAAFSHMPDVYAYSTSKQACVHFTACVAADVFPLGIRVNCVSPGKADWMPLVTFDHVAPASNGKQESQTRRYCPSLSLMQSPWTRSRPCTPAKALQCVELMKWRVRLCGCSAKTLTRSMEPTSMSEQASHSA